MAWNGLLQILVCNSACVTWSDPFSLRKCVPSRAVQPYVGPAGHRCLQHVLSCSFWDRILLCSLTDIEFRVVLLPQNPELNYRVEPWNGLNKMSYIALDFGVLGPQLVALFGKPRRCGLVGGGVAGAALEVERFTPFLVHSLCHACCSKCKPSVSSISCLGHSVFFRK